MFAELLRARLDSFLTLSHAQLTALEQHWALLQRWNRVVNLTSIKNLEDVIERHYCESLFLGLKLSAGNLKVADIGSGAGFPGIPVGILRSDCLVRLIECHERKSVFLREATRNLANITVVSKRVEEVEENFDWAVTRAVKFEDIEVAAARLTHHVAILGGDEEPSRACFTWNGPIQLPWGKRRFLWLGKASST